MEMEDHHHQLHHQQNHHYGCLTDLLMNNAPMHQSQPPQPPITLGGATSHHQQHHHRNLPPLPETTMTMFEMMGAPRGVVMNSELASTTRGSGVGGCMGGDASSNNGRWPRQETLTLLEIRSKLHPKFKDANHKGPLWEQVSRIMLEEHGYQRSGKKCREKFENLYKYYKKTKEGKAARQDGKHYRFFRQLEALFGDNNNNSNNFVTNNNLINLQTNQDKFHNHHYSHHHHNNNYNNNSVSLITNSTSEFDTSSSETDDDHESRKRKRRRWKMKMKMKEFIDSQMSKLVKKQEEWLEKLVKTFIIE
ncbi:trihelix transcription factor PTL [Arachis duranensis]|uniref:Trihelix transcription factor PTL n=1 Tax=Arachis duranensis TaxID=130453 RepID=A0A6P4CHH4_ARADU|nr:trihelix transcription factor PTL [Arachis duranensis]